MGETGDGAEFSDAHYLFVVSEMWAVKIAPFPRLS